MPRYDEDSDDEFEARRDAFLTGDSDVPVTGKQRREWYAEREHYREERRYWRR